MGKGLKDADPKYMVHSKYYGLKAGELLLLENVPEYEMERVVGQEMGKSWEVQAVVVDPRLFGFGTSRTRVYGLCWRKGSMIIDKDFPILKTLEALKARPTMSAKDYFWQKNCLFFKLVTPSEVSGMKNVKRILLQQNKYLPMFTYIRIWMPQILYPPALALRLATLKTTRTSPRTGRWPTWCKGFPLEGSEPIQWMAHSWLWPQTLGVFGARLCGCKHTTYKSKWGKILKMDT